MQRTASKPRRPGQTLALVAAWLCYAAALLCLAGAGYQGVTQGTDNPIFASLAASIVFFVGCGIVLQVMGTVSLPDLKIERSDE